LIVVSDDGMVKEGRMAGMSERVLVLEEKVQAHTESFQLLREDLVDLRVRIDRVDDKLDRGFLWLVGLQVGVLAAVVTGFVAVMGQLVGR
jgi:hypothetical protein